MGAVAFARDNVPTLMNILINRGKYERPPDPQVDKEEKIAKQMDQPVIQRRVKTYTADIDKGKELMYTALGAARYVQKNLSGFSGTFSAQGKAEIDQKVSQSQGVVSAKTQMVAKTAKTKIPGTKSEIINEQSSEEKPNPDLLHQLADTAVNVAQTAGSVTLSILGKLKLDPRTWR